MMYHRIFLACCVGILIIQNSWWVIRPVHAATTATELQAMIKDRNNKLAAIQLQIDKYKTELNKVGTQKKTLQSAINKLELERKKIQADINYTQQSISATDLTLNHLIQEISKTKKDISSNKEAIGNTIRLLNESDDKTLLEAILSYDHLSDFWGSVEALNSVRDGLSTNISTLSKLKDNLNFKQKNTAAQHDHLVTLKNQYTDQNKILVTNKTEQANLLAATKDKEVNYQKMLADQKTARDKLQNEVRDFESKLQFILDPASIPPEGTPVFNWPVNHVIVTQLFGGTEFAKRNAAVYGGRAYHPGVDFGVPSGTPIHAPLAGTVRAIGNTDAVPGCYSWGKWTLIDHANGLSTLYAHQSVQSVVPGQHINTSDVIGYSGNTGYTTGPHLHFTIYVKSAVTVRKFNEIKKVTGCGSATTPVAPTDAYLDPMLYLPTSGFTMSL